MSVSTLSERDNYMNTALWITLHTSKQLSRDQRYCNLDLVAWPLLGLRLVDRSGHFNCSTTGTTMQTILLMQV